MGTDMKFNNFTDDPLGEVGGAGRAVGGCELTRQQSIYSLTFDEFQSTTSGLSKDFGSMNMDELLKSIWNVEETTTQIVASSSGGTQEGGLPRQGSLTVPQKLSQKTVDEVWRDITSESGKGRHAREASFPQRQQTLGEMTLEEFLVRAGVVKEEAQVCEGINVEDALVGSFLRSGPDSGPAIGFQKNDDMQQQQEAAFPMQQHNVGYVSQMSVQNSTGILGLESADRGSPANHVPSDGMKRIINGEISSAFALPYLFGEGARGKRAANGAVEKVAERRQRRMIKNRESAARSRARKQAYTVELEAEITKLRQENQELQKKQDELVQSHRKQVRDMMKMQMTGKKQCLRRTQTGPW